MNEQATSDHLVRAAQARRRADEAGMRAAGLRQRRVTGSSAAVGTQQEDLDVAQSHALDAMSHLLDALENSALAHDRASVLYAEQVNKGHVMASVYAAKAAEHQAAAAADRSRAKDFQKTFDLLLVADKAS
jgi:hypothetical protein